MRAKALTFLNAISLITYVSAGQFNPRAYEASASKIATCNAIKRTVSPSSTGTGFDVVDEEHVQIRLRKLDTIGLQSVVISLCFVDVRFAFWPGLLLPMQTMSTSTLQRELPFSWFTGGPLIGQLGRIKLKNSRQADQARL